MLTLASLTGTAGVFLPFTWDVSPLRAIQPLPQLALPALLAPLATAGAIRWLISGSLSKVESIIAYFASASMMVLSLSVWLSGEPARRFDLHDLVTLSIHFLTFALGIGALIWNWRIGSRQFSPVMSIQAIYVAHVAMCLAGFFGYWEVGAYLILVAALVFATQVVLVLVAGREGRPPSAKPELKG
jgi:hypothetical protein